MVPRLLALCLVALATLANPDLARSESHPTNWRVWNTQDGMLESFISQVMVTPSGKILARHGDVSNLTVIDGLHTTRIPDTHSLGLIYENERGELYTFGPSGMLIYSGSQWTSYPVPEISSFSRFGMFEHFRWFEYPMSPDRAARIDAVPASGGRAVILTPTHLIEWSRATGGVRTILIERTAGIGRFLKISPGPPRTFLVTGTAGLGVLGEDGSWKRIETAPRFSHFWFPALLQSGEILVSARANSASQSLLIRSAQGWKEIYRGGLNVRGWEAAGRIWIMDDSRLLAFENGSIQPVNLPPDVSGKLMDAASDGQNFWLATTQGLARYTPSLWQTPPDAPPVSDIVNAIAQDRQGRLWFATGRNLISFFKGHWEQRILPAADVQGTGKTGAISPLDDGSIVLTTASTNHLLRIHPGSRRIEKIVHPEHRGIVWMDRRDGRSVWVESMVAGESTSRLEIFDGSFHTVPGGEALPITDMRAVLQTKDGSIWAGGTSGLIRIVDGRILRFEGDRLPPEDSAFALAQTEDGAIYIGHRGALSMFDGTRFRVLHTGMDRARRIAVGADRTIWIASGTGVHRVRNGEWLDNGEADGLPTDAAYTVFVDRDGGVWAGTTVGLSRYQPENDRDAPITVIPASRNLAETPPAGEVRFSFFGVDRWKQTRGDRLLFSWRLDSSTWSRFDSSQIVALRDLLSGSHTFAVRAMDRNGNIDPHPAQFSFVVMRPWYRQNGFYAVASLLAIALALLLRTAWNKHREVRYQSRHDALTGLANRRHFEDALQDTVEQPNASAAVLLIDLDGFKGVNDLFGHLAGDKLLAAIASRLRACLGKRDLIARLGGDEFAILIPDVRERTAVSDIADRIRHAVREGSAAHSRVVSASIGISFFPQDATSSFVLMRLADIAMYHSKSIKGDCWFFYEPSMKLDFRYSEMAGVVRAAIAEDRLVMCYQPIVDCAGALSRMEALIRIQDPVLGVIAPSLFIPVAERTGMIHGLGAWALRESLRCAADWWRQGSRVPVAVNVSPVQLDRPELVKEILQAIVESGLPPQALTIEITESAIAHSRVQAIEILDALRVAGVRIALDDFGTGYSSLSALNGFPIDELKLDRSFITSIDSPRTREVILQTVQLARKLGLEVVLEGIEEEQHRAAAIALGCDLLQGFLIAPPLDLEIATAFVVGQCVPEEAVLIA